MALRQARHGCDGLSEGTGWTWRNKHSVAWWPGDRLDMALRQARHGFDGLSKGTGWIWRNKHSVA
eukprot:1158282-Pelagomonas_calceolata.AAC.9